MKQHYMRKQVIKTDIKIAYSSTSSWHTHIPVEINLHLTRILLR